MNQRVVSVSRKITAPAGRIFDLLADPRNHPLLDGSGTLRAPRNVPERLSLGSRFSMSMKDRVSYFTTNKVVAFEEGRRIAWHHFAQFTWRFDLEEVADGTLVTESFDYSKPWGVVIVPLGWPERNRRSMARTLDKISDVLDSGS